MSDTEVQELISARGYTFRGMALIDAARNCDYTAVAEIGRMMAAGNIDLRAIGSCQREYNLFVERSMEPTPAGV